MIPHGNTCRIFVAARIMLYYSQEEFCTYSNSFNCAEDECVLLGEYLLYCTETFSTAQAGSVEL